jgi:MPBQ/MSBQ methyltransferase
MLALLLLLSGAVAALALWLWLKRDRNISHLKVSLLLTTPGPMTGCSNVFGVTTCISATTGIHHAITISAKRKQRSCTNSCAGAGSISSQQVRRFSTWGCGIGGSARILARDYNLDVVGISISPAQVARATDLTTQGLSCRFEVMDALDLQMADHSFDAVWSVEAGPHMPDKQRYADELLRVLKPGGLLAVADWNRRDPSDGAMT